MMNDDDDTQQQQQQNHHKKRGKKMKPRSKRNKKRPRSDLYDSIIDVENQDHEITFHRLELDGITASASTMSSTTTGIIGWLRTVEPYPYTFSSFAKARWIGRTALDVYSTEFGSYPKSYYESAITQGRILVSDKKVDSNYLIKGSDVLTHTVHRHEPGVAVYSNESPFVKIVNYDNDEDEDDDDVLVVDKPGTLPIHPCGGYHIQSLMNILEPIYGKLYTIHRLDRLTSGLVILGKTSSVAQEWGKAIMNRNCQKFYLARVKGKFPLNVNTIDISVGSNNIDNNDNNNIQNLLPHLMGNETTTTTTTTTTTKYPLNGEWTEATTSTTNPSLSSSSTTKVKKDVSMERRRNAYGYWITDGNETSVVKNNNETEVQLLQHVFDSQFDEDDWLRQQEEEQVTEEGNDNEQVVDNSNETKKKTQSLLKNPRNNMLWFHIACPTRVAKHKDGICEAGSFDTLDDELYLKGVKPAQTSFGVVRYDKHTDSTLVVCKPETGRTHQIRLHLQHLGHPIANDPNYGGEMWYGNPTGKHLSEIAKSKLDKINEDNRVEIDRTTNGRICSSSDVEILPPAPDGSASATNTPSSARRISDQPATEQEIVSAGITNATRQETESIHDFIRRTCVWCARAGKQQQQHQQVVDGGEGSTGFSVSSNRDMLEFLIRSNGIWLHALKYSFTVSGGRSVSYQAPFPSWAHFEEK